jgi:hypothetical protein
VSATEIPVLDPKNIIERKFSAPPDEYGYVRYNLYRYDPVAKIIVGWNPDGAGYGDPFVHFRFWPKMNEADIIQALIDGDPARPLRNSATVLELFLRRSFGYEHGGKAFDADVLYGFIEGHSLYGMGDRPFGGPTGGYNEGDPGFEFWPEGIPGRGKAITLYALHAALFVLERFADSDFERFPSKSKKVAIAVDDELLMHVGKDKFPTLKLLANGYYLILQGGQNDAG